MRSRTLDRATWAAVAVCAWSTPAAAQLTGVVRDSATQSPIGHAVVSIRALDLETRTDDQGRFSLGNASIDADGTVLTVAAVGYYIEAVDLRAGDDGGASIGAGVVVEIEAVPTSDGSPFTFPPVDACDRCHQEIYDSWQASAMASAGLNTWVLDIHDGTGTENGSGGFVYTRDSRFAEHNPSSECAACHQPERWLDDPGAAVSADTSEPGVMHGISCSICHRMANIDVSKTNYPGVHAESVTMTLAASGDTTIVQYGPLKDVAFERPNSMRPSYQPQILSELCAACHQDKNDPDEDGNFEEDNGVISEPTYLEWLQSSYADPSSDDYASCAHCHMTVRNADSACSEATPTPPRREGELRNHTFEGTTSEFLDNAVTLSLSVRRDGDELEVEASIHNDQTGHHVPTGVTIRNMILLVEASTTGDDEPLQHTGTQVVHDLGGVGDPADGYYAGLPGKLFGKINHGPDGEGPVFFSDATGIKEDNRIPANATDVSSYRFALPAAGGEVEVRARLIYRRSWRVLTDAKQWTEDGHGNPLADVLPPHFGHLMEEESVTMDLDAADAGCVGSGCPGATAEDDMDAGAPPTRADAGADTGTEAHPEDDDGCSCSAPGGGPGNPPLAFGLLFLAAVPRLRRRFA